jgi:hypothetical protein
MSGHGLIGLEVTTCIRVEDGEWRDESGEFLLWQALRDERVYSGELRVLSVASLFKRTELE